MRRPILIFFFNVLSLGKYGIGGGELGSMPVFMLILWLIFGTVLVVLLVRLLSSRWHERLVLVLLSNKCG